ncbi:flavin reductase family protein [Rhodococcus sp. BP-252]|uniref:flavin reductase family protein n=1 Tax=unclassified Rhodococcus (in: high G+C Gram-positive bacteria) TaxID=192944 RepID=UPI001C9AD884|nr:MULTISPECIES: flavin reductase family protein [unclassified Rhodococcus (in: high G+C Gram-positive bacteria)]MBY6414347.1 flavin reductase family protein [Rhodococcus sp. BP-320]MBY6419117.1 flavin reductase family protein [Rhodococcus sp. BP-321]MBY6423792.1 flavin reductase family protein [Rhodococcus sp. BP-324]MBY6429176.1 flavin reductase family protein [Rhodococcus sp. BP-323]MBY6434157.1 flavin reductase family protein [Rhodococcus sp. BP-322]
MTAPAHDPTHFRTVLGQFCTGVVVVTSVDDAGSPLGMAVGSFTSVSLDPPLVAFFVAHTSTTFPKIAASGRFCANILSHDQLDLCRAFSKSGGDKFAGIGWHPTESGVPVLDGAHGWIDCAIDSVQRLGDHDLVVGRVEQLDTDGADESPLVFYRAGFHALQR